METPVQDLAGDRVLLLENEYFIADDLNQFLRAHVASCLGLCRPSKRSRTWRGWLAQGLNPRRYAFEVVTAVGELVLVLPFFEALDRQSGRQPVRLSRTASTAKVRGEPMTHLTMR